MARKELEKQGDSDKIVSEGNFYPSDTPNVVAFLHPQVLTFTLS